MAKGDPGEVPRSSLSFTTFAIKSLRGSRRRWAKRRSARTRFENRPELPANSQFARQTTVPLAFASVSNAVIAVLADGNEAA